MGKSPDAGFGAGWVLRLRCGLRRVSNSLSFAPKEQSRRPSGRLACGARALEGAPLGVVRNGALASARRDVFGLSGSLSGGGTAHASQVTLTCLPGDALPRS